MYLGKWKLYLTETCSFPGTDRLFDIWFTQNNLFSLGPWVAFIELYLVLCICNDCSSTDWISWSTFFSKLKWPEVALAKMVTSLWLYVLKEHLLFSLHFHLHHNLMLPVLEPSEELLLIQWNILVDVVDPSQVKPQRTMPLCVCVRKNNHSHYLSNNFEVDSVTQLTPV